MKDYLTKQMLRFVKCVGLMIATVVALFVLCIEGGCFLHVCIKTMEFLGVI